MPICLRIGNRGEITAQRLTKYTTNSKLPKALLMNCLLDAEAYVVFETIRRMTTVALRLLESL